MCNQSLFKASFEESLNLQDDGFLQFQKKDYYNKLGKAFRKGKPSFGFAVQTIILSLLFPIGINFMFLVFSISLQDSDPKDLTLPIFKQPLLTVEVYLLGLLIWLLLVLIGKFFRRTYILPYRYRFHIMTFLIWFMLEFNLLAITVSLPTLSIWGIISIFTCISILFYLMFTFEIKSLRKLIYGDVSAPRLIDKIANKIAVYGMGILGLGVIINIILKGVSVKLSTSMTGFGLLLTWIILNIALIAILIFMEFPFFLEGYYKWKYPEEYRKLNNKSIEEWYGKKYLKKFYKKHKELI